MTLEEARAAPPRAARRARAGQKNGIPIVPRAPGGGGARAVAGVGCLLESASYGCIAAGAGARAVRGRCRVSRHTHAVCVWKRDTCIECSTQCRVLCARRCCLFPHPHPPRSHYTLLTAPAPVRVIGLYILIINKNGAPRACFWITVVGLSFLIPHKLHKTKYLAALIDIVRVKSTNERYTNYDNVVPGASRTVPRRRQRASASYVRPALASFGSSQRWEGRHIGAASAPCSGSSCGCGRRH